MLAARSEGGIGRGSIGHAKKAGGQRESYKVGEEVSGLSHAQLVLVAEPGDEVDVGLDARRVGLQADIDEAGEELVGGRGVLVGRLEHLEDLLAGQHQAVHLVLRSHLAVHAEDVWREIEENVLEEILPALEISIQPLGEQLSSPSSLPSPSLTVYGFVQEIPNDLTGLVDGAVQVLGRDPVQSPDSTLQLQVLLLVGRRRRAEEVLVAADHHILLGQVQNLLPVGIREA